jgi:hypothetical protein
MRKYKICKEPVIFIAFQRIFNFLDRFYKKVQISNFIKIRPVGVKLLHADGRTDMTKLMVAFRNLETRLKIYGGTRNTYLRKVKHTQVCFCWHKL